MQHLTLEAIARLVDEAPEPEEALHLRECLRCRRELADMRTQIEELAQLADPEPSPRGWAELEARLAQEGLVKRRGAAPREHAWLRVAAAIALLVIGGTAGISLWGGGGAGPATVEPLPREPRVASAPTPEWHPEDAPLQDPVAPSPAAGEIVRVAATEPPAARRRDGGPRQQAAERDARIRDARAALHEAERDYLRALAEYAQAASEEGADPVTRLATLEGLVRSTRYALERAPDDPVINGYHLAAMGQRDAMLRQIARSTEETWY